MYYEEKVINGVIMCRTTPGGEWRQCSIEEMGELVAQNQWPDEDDPRQQAIEQNGNDGVVYEYVPKVGEWCEALDGANAYYYIGTGSEECHVFQLLSGGVIVFDTLEGFRPLRTERERFIQAGESIDSDKIKTAEDFLGALFDAGFKAPEVSE